MSEVPQNDNTITQALLSKWYTMAQQLKELRGKEMLLRKSIFGLAWSDPKEGTNKFDMEDGYCLKGTHVIDRSVDQGAYDAIKDKLLEMGVKVDDLVKYKPSLSTSAYRKLTDEQRNFFDQCLVIKPGSPSLEIVKPKAAK